MTEDDNKKIDNIEKLVEVIAGSVASLTDSVAILTVKVDTMATDLAEVKSDVSVLKTDMAEVKSDLSSFKQETRENFDKVNGRLDDLEETVGGIVKDYHPRIIALEEKVFGHSTLAEA